MEKNFDSFEFEDDSLDRVISYNRLPEDREENQLRPSNWQEYFGQTTVKENMKVFIQGAVNRKEALDHVLLYGPPGLGKTTLAGIIASELKVNIRITSGPAIERAGDLAAILSNLQPNDVLFVDEIHRLNRSIEEILYPAMEDYSLDIIIGKGPSARSIRIDLAPFTLIGATTRAGNLSAPLRDRFGVVCRLEMYSTEELSQIIKRDAALLNIGIDESGLHTIASRSRGTPRIAIRLLKRLRDFAQYQQSPTITGEIAEFGFKSLGIDELGLDDIDRSILNQMIDLYNGGPVGLETISAITGEDKNTIEDMYEPYLMKIGFLSKTPRGRILSPSAFIHVGKPHQGSF